MRLLITLCLIGLTVCNPLPGFRYAYIIPQENDGQPWSQFNERTDGHYSWGYAFPGRVHFESRDDSGTVKGSFGYVDANGNPNVWKYISDPVSGFQVETGVRDALTEASATATKAELKPAPTTYIARQEPYPFDFPSYQLVEDNISPLLKQAALANEVIPFGKSTSGIPQYVVNPKAAEEAGGVSALAVRLGAIPVAAVHDVRGRPTNLLSDSAFSPVLVHRENSDLYTVEVAIQ